MEHTEVDILSYTDLHLKCESKWKKDEPNWTKKKVQNRNKKWKYVSEKLFWDTRTTRPPRTFPPAASTIVSSSFLESWVSHTDTRCCSGRRTLIWPHALTHCLSCCMIEAPPLPPPRLTISWENCMHILSQVYNAHLSSSISASFDHQLDPGRKIVFRGLRLLQAPIFSPPAASGVELFASFLFDLLIDQYHCLS